MLFLSKKTRVAGYISKYSLILACLGFSYWLNFVSFSARAAETIFCTDQEISNLTDPGIPTEPTRFETWPTGLVEYDNENFIVFQRSMHDRAVTVAIAEDYDLSKSVFEAKARQEAAEFIFKTWNIFWHEFGGFPYSSYTVVIDDNLPYAGSGYGRGIQQSWNDTENWAHEIFHSWNGNAFRQENERMWFSEGVTNYYGIRQSDNTYIDGLRNEQNYTYYDRMTTYYDWYTNGYLDMEGNHVQIKDVIIGDQSLLDPNYNHSALSMKANLVAYLLDKKLKNSGHHLGEVMKIVYQRYGVEDYGTYPIEGEIKSNPGYITNQEILSIFNEVSGEDFSDFFNRYIYGNELLPLNDGNFEWICHGEEKVIKSSIMNYLPAILGAAKEGEK